MKKFESSICGQLFYGSSVGAVMEFQCFCMLAVDGIIGKAHLAFCLNKCRCCFWLTLSAKRITIFYVHLLFYLLEIFY